LTAVGPSLEAELRRRIAGAGPIPVAEYMTLCLTHPQYGYYMTRDPFGAGGDFVTAPEISQMFGELLGLWTAGVWQIMGAPENVRLVELGPGRATMMRDALRAAMVLPGLCDALVVHFVEVSPALEQRQRSVLEGIDIPMQWHKSLADVPDGPMIILANEFFDALPVHQAVKQADGWYERAIGVDAVGNFAFVLGREPIPHFEKSLPHSIRQVEIGQIFEWRPDRDALELGRRVLHGHGAALVIDYGHVESATGDTLQAVGRHSYVNPLAAPGLVDLTAHVDFQALAQASESMGARALGPIDQGEFLRRLGIEQRAMALRAHAKHDQVPRIEQALRRLTMTGPTGMGGLFKVLALAHPALGPLPGFET
jgi:NADH dehydrogenase [ubiquinone] 1 alpha subcomplex assembly factor 7